MHTRWLPVVVACALSCAACSFEVRAGTCTEPCEVIDAPPDDTGLGDGAASDAAPDAFVPGFCDPAAGELIACYELEGTAEDGSPNGLDGVASGVTFVAGRVGTAAHVEAGATIVVDENALLDSPAITMEAWIRPTRLPVAGSRAGIVDNDSQYGLFLHPGGELRCLGLDVAAGLKARAWAHVACTYDGTVRIYVDGVQVGASGGGGAALGSSGATGVSIAGNNPSGSPLDGDIDQVRIFKVARTAAQICAAAGASSCP